MYRKGEIVMVRYRGERSGFSIIRILNVGRKSNKVIYTYKRLGYGKGGDSIDNNKLRDGETTCQSYLDNTEFFGFSIIDEKKAILEVL